MQGAGNDYIYINTLRQRVAADPTALARRLSAPHFGIGADGIVLIGAPQDAAHADFAMRIFNADGSEAEMCGNAARCVGKYLYERHLTDRTSIRLETLSGVKTLALRVVDGSVESVTVDMLAPSLEDEALFARAAYAAAGGSLVAGDRTFSGTFVSMGNPHFVIFVDDLAAVPLGTYGPLLEEHSLFPAKCNIEFAQLLAADTLRVRVWERGSGITLACGTGACATAVAAAVCGLSSRRSTIVMDGGTLHIHWDAASGHVFLTGPAAFVFDGTIEI